ncbi:MAG: isocitrate dehydrogenase (NAD(+)) [Nitrospinota bacterium]
MSNQVHRVTLIEGDGIGPEVAGAACRIIEAAGVQIEWEKILIGVRAREIFGELIPPGAYESIRKNKVALKGPTQTPVGEGFPSMNVALRKNLDLFACVRPVRTVPGVPSIHSNVDLVVVRENTEDLYAGLEHEIVPGVIESLKVITEKASTRIARFAFELAKKEGRESVTAVHKANIMKLSDGLFLDCCRKVAGHYPDIRYRELIVDNACLQIIRNPEQFSVLLMENLYGDIISDVGAALVGGIGLVPGANYGDAYAVFEAVHGTAPDLAGKNVANPLAILFSSLMMLRHLREDEAADLISEATSDVLREGKVRTPDLGGTAGTTEFAHAIIARIDRLQDPAGE